MSFEAPLGRFSALGLQLTTTESKGKNWNHRDAEDTEKSTEGMMKVG